MTPGTGDILSGIANIAKGQLRTIEFVVETDICVTASIIGCFGKHVAVYVISTSDKNGLTLEYREGII